MCSGFLYDDYARSCLLASSIRISNLIIVHVHTHTHTHTQTHTYILFVILLFCALPCLYAFQLQGNYIVHFNGGSNMHQVNAVTSQQQQVHRLKNLAGSPPARPTKRNGGPGGGAAATAETSAPPAAAAGGSGGGLHVPPVRSARKGVGGGEVDKVSSGTSISPPIRHITTTSLLLPLPFFFI